MSRHQEGEALQVHCLVSRTVVDTQYNMLLCGHSWGCVVVVGYVWGGRGISQRDTEEMILRFREDEREVGRRN